MGPKQKKLLRNIMELQFATTETGLYLDTHPADSTVLDIHRNFTRALYSTMQEYQDRYTLVTNKYPDPEYPWEWIEEPWPWQINYS